MREKQGAFEFIKYFTNADNQAKWTMSTGYVAVNQQINDNADYQAYVEENPAGSSTFCTGCSWNSISRRSRRTELSRHALKVAADKVEIDGIDAKTALDEAQATAQAALDEALGK